MIEIKRFPFSDKKLLQQSNMIRTKVFIEEQKVERELEYEFEAKLDTGGFFPSIRVKEKGSFSLSGKDKSPEAESQPET